MCWIWWIFWIWVFWYLVSLWICDVRFRFCFLDFALPAPTAVPLPTPGALPVPLVPLPMPTAVPLPTPAVVPQAESSALPFPAIGCGPNGPYWGVGVCLSRLPAHGRRLRATGTPLLELWPTHFATQAPPTTDQVRRAHVSLRRSPSLWEASHDGQCLSTVGGLPALR